MHRLAQLGAKAMRARKQTEQGKSNEAAARHVIDWSANVIANRGGDNKKSWPGQCPAKPGLRAATKNDVPSVLVGHAGLASTSKKAFTAVSKGPRERPSRGRPRRRGSLWDPRKDWSSDSFEGGRIYLPSR